MLSLPDLQALASLEDRMAIRDAVHRYARGIDRHDNALVESSYFADGIDNHGDQVAYRAEFIEWGNALHEVTSVQHSHQLTTQSISLRGEEAHSEAYVLFVIKRKDLKTIHIGGARYLDHLEKRDGLWRILLRRVVLEWRCNVAQEEPSEELSDLPIGTWDRSDPSYAVLESQ